MAKSKIDFLTNNTNEIDEIDLFELFRAILKHIKLRGIINKCG